MIRARNGHFLVLVTAFAASSIAVSGCSKKAEAEAEASVTSESAAAIEEPLTEEHDGGSVDWSVAPDGTVKAIVRSKDGKPIDKDVSGTLDWKTPDGVKKIPLAPDPKTGVLVAAGPKLEGDLTEVKYTVVVAGKPWNGALHLPAGGTPAIIEGAKKASVKPIPAGKVGPNGGVIQVVGDDTIEIVADKASGQVRVYVLDADLKPIPVGNRKIKLGVVGSSSEVVVLSPDPAGLYCFGTLTARANPVKITIAITYVDHSDVVIVGHRPGVHVLVGAAAPSINILVVTSWNVGVKVRTPGVIVVDDDDDDDIHIHLHGHGHGHGRHKGHGVIHIH